MKNDRRAKAMLSGVVALLLVALAVLFVRASLRTNHVALASAPRPVSTVRAQAASYRPQRSYVGTTTAWSSARVGPQYVAAYVGTVLVRPGAIVKRGQVLATLDCRNASASARAVSARAEALAHRQSALEHESKRTEELTQSGFASANEAEQLRARSAAESAEVASLRASMTSRSLEVDDCVLRAPFDGEVAERYVDPGAYVRPGSPIVTVLDRGKVRVTADVPEADFAVVAPGVEVHVRIEATGTAIDAEVSRRAPNADDSTRTVHFEVDLANADRLIPAGGTARVSIDVGEAKPSVSVPLRAAALRGQRATLFVARAGRAHRTTVEVLGERAGVLFLAPTLPAGTEVVLEGRALLEDGDAVDARASTL